VAVGNAVVAMICANPGTSSETASVQNVSTGKAITSVPIPPPSPTSKVVGENAVWIVSEPSEYTGTGNGFYFPTYGEIFISQISAQTDVSTGNNSYDLASQNVQILNMVKSFWQKAVLPLLTYRPPLQC
jgi:Peptidase A4 family